MKTLLAATLSFVFAMSMRAEAIDTAIVAAMKLSEQPSYSWTCTVIDDAQTYQIEGKTRQSGYTWQRQPMPKKIAQRLGRGADRELEAIFSSPSRYVIQTDKGWKTLDELPKRHDDWSEDGDWYYVSVPVIRGPEFPADETQGGSFGLPTAVYLPLLRDRSEEDRAYSNAQFALALPHEELAVIVSSHGEFHVDGDTASGTLSDIGAQLLLVHDGHEYIKPVTAAGRFTLWIREGMVTKYKLELAGVLVVKRDAVYVRQTSTTMLQDVGTTTLDVPEHARRKLGG